MYLKKDGCFSMVSLWSQQILVGFIKHQIMSYILNFLVEILLILMYDLSFTDQTMNDFPFHVMWVVGLEVQITTCMSRFHQRTKTESSLRNVDNVEKHNNCINCPVCACGVRILMLIDIL
jgi:hypothetical protein